MFPIARSTTSSTARNFVTDSGDEASRANVRSCIRRIRKKLRQVDPESEHIHNYARFGYHYS